MFFSALCLNFFEDFKLTTTDTTTTTTITTSTTTNTTTNNIIVNVLLRSYLALLESEFDIYDPDSEPAAPARILHLRITQAFFRQMKMLVNATYKCTDCMYVCMYKLYVQTVCMKCTY